MFLQRTLFNPGELDCHPYLEVIALDRISFEETWLPRRPKDAFTHFASKSLDERV